MIGRAGVIQVVVAAAADAELDQRAWIESNPHQPAHAFGTAPRAEHLPGSPMIELLLVQPRRDLRVLECLAKLLALKQVEVIKRVWIPTQSTRQNRSSAVTKLEKELTLRISHIQVPSNT